MDIKNNTKQKGLGKGFLLERKQRISIEGRGDMYIKNTQTQVRELFGREHAEKSRRTSSSSRKDTKLLSTSVQVDALHKKIESEIGKLKNFRKSFLRDTSGKAEKQTQILTGQYEEINFVDNSVAANWREVLNLEIESPETRNTMRVLSSPQSGSSIDCYAKPEPDGSEGQLADPSKQPITRMCGGCNKGYCDAASGSYSIYQTDYCHRGSPCSRRMSDCQQCYPGNANCLTCNMSRAVAVPMPVSYSSNPCYQYPVGALYQKYDMFMPQRNGCDIYTCNCPRNSYCKRTTDLNTADFCCNWYPDPVATVNRVVNSKEIPQSKFQFTPKQPMQAGGKEKGKSDSPPKSANKIIKISYKHQKGGLKDSGQIKENNKVSTKKYVTAKKKPEEVADVNAEKLRMHRKYMEMYKTEHKKTANKDSSQNNSELDTCPTYTKLPVQEGKDAELSASYIKERGPSTKQNQITPTHQSSPERIKECAEQLQPVEQINIPGDKQQITQNFNAESKSYKLMTLSIKRNDNLEKLAPITHELTVLGSPDTENINDGLIWPQLTPEIQLPSARSQQSPIEENRSDIRSQQLNNQYCQMSSKNQMPSDRVVPSEKTECFNIEDTQADIQLNHPQLLTTLISNQSCQTSPRNQTSPSRNVWSYRAQSQVQETQTDIRDDKEWQLIRSDQGTNILNTPTNQNLKLNCKKASTFREETTFSKYDKKQESNGNKQQKEPKICSARNASRIDKSQITGSAICARNFIPWHTLRRREGNRRMIENYKLMIQHKRIESLHPESESIQSITDKTLTPAANHKDGNCIDIGDQTTLPAVSVNSDYKSISQYTELNNQAEQNDNGRIESNTNLMSFNGPMRNRDKSMPVHSIVHTMPPSDCFNPCEAPCTFENNSGPSTSQQQAIIKETVCTEQCVRQRLRRSVTFQDESGLSNRSVIDWELLPKLSMERDTAGAQIPLDDTDDDLLDSYRSSSTANTEFTCNESNYEDEYSNFNESFREYIPPFTGCPCMYNKYLRLVAKCRASN